MSVVAIALLITLVTTAAFTLVGLASAGRSVNLENYLVHRNQVGGWQALATVVASSLGAWILFSPAEAGSFFGGISAILGYCIGSAGAVALFCFVGPRLRHLMPNGHSLNEYVKYRYGGVMYWLVEAVMLLYMFVYLTAELTAIAKALQLVANVPLGVTALVVITAVFIYTTYGGLRASILTDSLQFIIIVPLLLAAFGITLASLGGFAAAFEPIRSASPELLSLGNIGGLRFGATLMIAIIAAEIFNQGNWQRVYACRDSNVVRGSFLGSALLILPLLFIAGLLGLMAVQFGFASDTAFFELLGELAVPGWVLMGVVVLALALVMSSLDTLLNGIASLFALDLMAILPGHSAENTLRASRLLTVVVGLPAIAIASQGYSVLYLFFIADLICAAVLFPVLFGLYSRHITRNNAFWSSLIGIAVGLLFFPKPDFSPLFPIPGAADLLHSFAAALIVSTAISWVWSLVSRQSTGKAFSFSTLQRGEDELTLADARAFAKQD